MSYIADKIQSGLPLQNGAREGRFAVSFGWS
jgi:hypothetical protein